MSFNLAPYESRQYFDGVGNPLAGGRLEWYEAGTSTPTPTYKDRAGTLNTWPVVCDSEGRCDIYLGPLTYKLIGKTAAGVVVPGIGGDQIGGAPEASGLGSVFNFGGASGAPITNLDYLPGPGFETLHPGTAVYPVDSGTLPAGVYVIQLTGLCYPTGTLTVAIVNLTDGAPDTPLATAAITHATGAVGTSGPITWPAPGTVKQYGIKPRVSLPTGYAWGIALVRQS